MNKRSIDSAMNSKRPQKQSVRKLWLDEIKDLDKKYADSEYPLYLTLPGEEGYDIQMLIDQGLINLTENKKSISEKHLKKVIAVESNNGAILNLQKKFPGLRIEHQNIQNILKGSGLESWPNDEEKEIFCSHIVNLDFDGSIKYDYKNGAIIFKELEWIYKICLIRTNEGLKNWKLFLTFNANLSNWDVEVFDYIKNFIFDNIKHEKHFSDQCKELFGEKLFPVFNNEDNIEDYEFTHKESQKILMIFVPKFLSNKLHVNGWTLKTKINLYYGELPETAPMVTWIINFNYDESKLSTPKLIYKESILSIFDKVGYIDKSGEIKN